MIRNKYGSRKVQVDGITFDSQKEAYRYNELKLLERAGKISNLELQPKFELIPTQRYKGKTLRKMSYYADFKYLDEEGNVIVEDTKGFKTDVYQIKKKLLIQKYGEEIDFREL